MKHCKQLAHDWSQYSQGSIGSNEVEYAIYSSHAVRLSIAIELDENIKPKEFTQSWHDRSNDLRKRGLAIGMLTGLCHLVNPDLKEEIIKVLDRIEEIDE